MHGDLIISNKRNHATTFATVSDDETNTRENQRAKRHQTQLQEQADGGLRPIEVKIKQFDQEIKDVERETANAPRTIQNYESELQGIDAQIEKLREQKERIQDAKVSCQTPKVPAISKCKRGTFSCLRIRHRRKAREGYWVENMLMLRHNR